MPEETEATNTPEAQDSGQEAEASEQDIAASILNPEHSIQQRTGAEEQKAEPQTEEASAQEAPTSDGKTEKELAAERKMHEATQEAALLKKALEESGLRYEDGRVVQPEPVQEDDGKTDADKFYEDPVGFTDQRTIDLATKIVEAKFRHNEMSNSKWKEWQNREDFSALEKPLNEAIKTYAEFLPVEQDFIANPQEASVRFDKVTKMIEAVAIGNAGADALKQAELNGKAKAEEEQRQKNLAAGIPTGSRKASHEPPAEKSPQQEVVEGILTAGKQPGSFF